VAEAAEGNSKGVEDVEDEDEDEDESRRFFFFFYYCYSMKHPSQIHNQELVKLFCSGK